MRVWIDQDCCTGAGLCVDHCPDLFIVLEDGIGYIHLGDEIAEDPGHVGVPVPPRYEHDVVDAAERCPGECIYLESNPATSTIDDGDVLDAEIVPDPASKE